MLSVRAAVDGMWCMIAGISVLDPAAASASPMWLLIFSATTSASVPNSI